MREDEDHIRHYVPVLRRIIILLAVLTAIPVVMWTITAFVRTYVGPPKTPTFQPMASRASVTPDQAAAAPAQNPPASPAEGATAAPLPTIVEAKATTTDAGFSAPLGDPNSTGAPAAGPADATPAAAAPGRADSANSAASNPAASAPPSPAPDNTMQLAAQQPAATNWPTPPPSPAVDALPPGEPIAGPVPLPRKRPKTFVVAQMGVPLPMPRPDVAGPGAAAAPATPLDWLHNIFQPSSGAAAPPPSQESDGYVETPH